MEMLQRFVWPPIKKVIPLTKTIEFLVQKTAVTQQYTDFFRVFCASVAKKELLRPKYFCHRNTEGTEKGI